MNLPEENKKILCANEKCKFKPSKENKYCMKHQLCLFVDETIETNKKVCANYIRGCRNQLEIDYKFNKCQECLENYRIKDKEKRDNAKEKQETNQKTNQESDQQICSTCCKELPIDYFIGFKQQTTKTCKNCREQNKIQDLKRDKEHRNELARKSESKPERIEVKKEWNENNYEKVAMKTLNYRQRQIEEDQEEYMKRNAENAKNWRENNPEKVAENNENKKLNKNLQYNVYTRCANDKNLEFTLSIEDFEKRIVEPCYYCGIIQDKGFNGIDRKDQTTGYILENCVSCCQMCNYMKGSLSDEVFIKRVEHILTNNKIIEGNLYPDCFGEHRNTYRDYKYSAIRKQLDFMITEEEYNLITNKDCYICGKEGSNTHKNGIDRFDSDIGYILENARPCCGECNFMKKKYNYNDVFGKFILIYKKHQEIRLIENVGIQNINDVLLNKIMVKCNKKSKEEMKENAILRKQKQREQLKQKYSDEEYKKKKAEEIAKCRKERNEK